MIRTMMFSVIAAAILCLPVGAQKEEKNDSESLKKEILEKVREKIRSEHEKLLDDVARVIEEELQALQEERARKAEAEEEARREAEDKKAREEEEARRRKEEEEAKKDPYAENIKRLDREIRRAQMKILDLVCGKRHLERFQEDLKIQRRLKGSPLGIEDAGTLFDEGISALEQKKFEESINSFKRIFYAFRENRQYTLAGTSAYNVSCGYALSGDRERALDWLEISVKAGFNSFDHMREDPDLESLRGDLRYKRLLADH